MEHSPADARRERAIVLLIAAVQFINILDFVMVMPLGPDFARALGFAESENGYVAGAYTLAAGVSGFIGSFFLDRFDRRLALTVALCGLTLGTAAGGLAHDLPTLLAARCLAGVFGGPATSLSFAIIADVVPPERRGRAMGMVMGAFGAASVLGIPAGVWLAGSLSWRAPFFAVAALGGLVAMMTAAKLPALRAHLDGPGAAAARATSLGGLLAQPLVRRSYLLTAAVMAAGFSVIPNISAYMQNNLGVPRAHIPLIYLVGGALSFTITPIAGKLVDRLGSLRVGTFGSLLFVGVLASGYLVEPPGVWRYVTVLLFFVAMSPRNVAYNTLTTKVPAPQYRARFQSIQSTVQHAASSTGGFLSSALMSTSADGRVIGMPRVAMVAIALSLCVPFLLAVVERGVRAGSAARASGALPDPTTR